MCETKDNKTTARKFDSHTRHVADRQNCETNKEPWEKLDEHSVSECKSNMSYYLNSSTSKPRLLDYLNSNYNKETDKRVSKAITPRIRNEFNSLIHGVGCLKTHFPSR